MTTKQTGTVDSMVDNTLGCVERLRSGCMLVGFSLLFLFFVALFLYFANRDYRLDQVGVVTVGTVIGLEESDSAEGGCCVYSPVVEFKVNEQTYAFSSSNASDPPRYEIGEQVSVQYDPNNPKRADIESSSSWLLWVGLAGLFVVIMLGLNVWGGQRIWRGEAIDE